MKNTRQTDWNNKKWCETRNINSNDKKNRPKLCMKMNEWLPPMSEPLIKYKWNHNNTRFAKKNCVQNEYVLKLTRNSMRMAGHMSRKRSQLQMKMSERENKINRSSLILLATNKIVENGTDTGEWKYVCLINKWCSSSNWLNQFPVAYHPRIDWNGNLWLDTMNWNWNWSCGTHESKTSHFRRCKVQLTDDYNPVDNYLLIHLSTW